MLSGLNTAEKQQANSIETLHRILEDERYTPVREVYYSVGEGIMQGYFLENSQTQ